MSWMLAGGVTCAVLVVLAGLLVGRGMRALDRHAESPGGAAAGQGTGRRAGSAALPEATGWSCRCGLEDCVSRDVREELVQNRRRTEPR